MESSEAEFLLEFFKAIPLNYTESHEEIKSLGLYDSMDEENLELLKELKSREETLKFLIKNVHNFIIKSEKDLKSEIDLNSFLKTKLESTIIKLNNYKIGKSELLRQNQLARLLPQNY